MATNPRGYRPDEEEEGSNKAVAGNFFAPFFDVEFLRPAKTSGTVEDDEGATTEPITGSNIELKTTSGESKLLTRDGKLSQIRNFRSSLSLYAPESSAQRAVLKLHPPYADALEIIDSELITFSSFMLVEWGYTNADAGEPILSSKAVFTITEPQVSFGSDEVTIEITGYDRVYTAASSVDRRCFWPREEYKTDLDIIKKLLQSHFGATHVFDDHIPDDSELRKERLGSPWIQTDDDWTFLRKLCRINDVGFIHAGRTFALKDYSNISTLAPKYRLMIYAQPESATDIPIISFNANSQRSLFNGGQGDRGVTVFSHDLDDNSVSSVGVDPANTGSAHEGDLTSTGDTAKPLGSTDSKVGELKAYSRIDETCSSGWILVQPSGRPGHEFTADVEARTKRRANTHATVVIPGHPGIEPLSIVEIFGEKLSGVGKKFSGNYKVMGVTHEIGQGYITKFDLLRSSSSSNPRDLGTRSKDASNTKSVRDTTADDGVSPKVAEDSSKSVDDAFNKSSVPGIKA